MSATSKGEAVVGVDKAWRRAGCEGQRWKAKCA